MRVALALVGPGLIGRTLLLQLDAQATELSRKLGVKLELVAVANSKRMVMEPNGISMDAWRQALESSQSRDIDLPLMASSMAAVPAPCKVLIDCTASDAVPEQYCSFMSAGCHIITPNKKMGAGPRDRHQQLQQLQLSTGKMFLGEATVGAGLPVMSTLRSLLETGDRVVRIEGVLSGTLSYVFNNFSAARQFSEVVGSAKALGYTEPDPREDLSGLDVARKVVILARECGMQADLDSMEVQSLVPGPLQQVPDADSFMAALPQHDGEMAALAAEAEAEGGVLRYVGVVDVQGGSCGVKVARYPASHPLAQLQGSDNLLAFTTARYSSQPLIVRGPGAGAEVTAMGVFSDLITIIKCQGRSSE